MSKEAYYFSHDSNARHDPKILSMRSVYGSEGYGWYWIIIEMLREQENHKIEITKYVWNALAMQTQCNADAMQSYVEDCIKEFKLLNSDGEFFWSDSLNRRMELKSDKSEKARKAAEARWNKSNKDKGSTNDDAKTKPSNANAMQTHSERNAIKERKVKESKVKEIKDKRLKDDDTSDIIQSLIDNQIVQPGGLNKQLSDDLNDIFENFRFTEPEQVILEAIKFSARGNGRTWRFVFNKLDLWRKQGIKSVTDATNFENKPKGNTQTRFGKAVRTEKEPKWLKETDTQHKQTPEELAAFEEEKRKLAERINKFKSG
ncbi:Lin1244/Lin1753 domain-containing protein [Metabacillus herbersteinensis]|uniref:Lin1244/Lin1753 domain-containing protein n=1 Tax=Metabacillus herbersteinensis TaxID=283816 RepID=A0ABV6GCF3_9BACI